MSGSAYRLRVTYRKTGMGRFISQRNFGKVIERCLRRIGFPLKFSQGFHPHPKISFGPSLPVGIEGENEALDIGATGRTDPELFRKRINEVLPDGVEVTSAEWVSTERPSAGAEATAAVYTIRNAGADSGSGWDRFGTILEENPGEVRIRTVLRDFSHRELLQQAAAARISRRILWTNRSFRDAPAAPEKDRRHGTEGIEREN